MKEIKELTGLYSWVVNQYKNILFSSLNDNYKL